MTASLKLIGPLAVVLASLSGCQTLSGGTAHSVVEPIPGVDGTLLGFAIASMVAQVWPTARSPLFVLPTADGGSSDALTSALKAQLEKDGAVVLRSAASVTATTHRLQYWVTPWDRQALVRLQLDGAAVSQVVTEDPVHGLIPASPLTVRN